MRLSIAAKICAAAVLAFPALAHADTASDIVKIFGRDPGKAEAHACFVRRYAKENLVSHPKRNVTDMLVYMQKSEGDDPNYGLNFQVHFKRLNKPFQAYGSCLPDEKGKKTFSCGIDCDGGGVEISVKDTQSFVLAIPNYARVMDLENPDPTVDLPAGTEFLDEDKLFQMQRTALKDCLPLIYDEAIKAKINQGVLTQ